MSIPLVRNGVSTVRTLERLNEGDCEGCFRSVVGIALLLGVDVGLIIGDVVGGMVDSARQQHYAPILFVQVNNYW